MGITKKNKKKQLCARHLTHTFLLLYRDTQTQRERKRERERAENG